MLIFLCQAFYWIDCERIFTRKTSVEIKDGKLILNGSEVAAEVAEKYKSYIEADKNLKLEIDEKTEVN